MVFNMLGAAIGKSNRVATGGGISVTVFAGRESSLGVIILDSISVFIYSWSFIGWFMIRSWFVYYWGMIRSWSWVIDWGMNLSVVDWSWVVWSSMMDWGVSVCWGVDWDVSWGVDSSAVLFSRVWVVYGLWGSMRLASNNSVVGSVGFVYGVAY